MKARRFAALDAWRGLCALLVALGHLHVTSVAASVPLVERSYRFVDFFFVLSGFVIAHSYRDRLRRGWPDVRAFVIRRLGRLWPLHVAVLAAFVVFELGVALAAEAGVSAGRQAFSEDTALASLPANLALVQSWGVFDHDTWNNPSWSISTELFAYLAFAAMCALLPTRRIDAVAAVLLGAAAAIIVFVAPSGMASTFDFGLVRCVLGFMGGVLVRAAWGRWPLRVGTLGELGVSLVALAAVAGLPHGRAEVAVVPVFGAAVWIFASESGAVSRRMRAAWPQRLGSWSYSIYMVHALIMLCLLAAALVANRFGLHLFGRVDGIATIVAPEPIATGIALLYVGVVVVVARFTYRAIERRGQRLFERWVGRGPSTVDLLAPAADERAQP